MPLATDYVSVIQTPSVCFADAELAAGQPAMNVLGLPLTYPGAFATVYKMECPNDQAWAVKCFTRHVPDLQERYAAISQHLEKNRRKFAVEFRYLEQGIKIKGAWYPILKMRWVEGFTLNEFLRDRAGNSSLLEQLCPLWLRLGYELRASKMAHADLQHGNVLLVPGKDATAMVLRLIDYDGMWVPELEGRPPGEVGHPNYQHPQRLREGGYHAEIDRFAHLVIYVAFRCLAVGGVALWEKHDNGENLLFKESDFRAPAASKLWPDLLSLPDPTVVTLVAHLLAASQLPLERVPLAADLLADGKMAPLSGEERDAIRERAPNLRASRLVPSPKPAAPPPPLPAPDQAGDPGAAPARRSKIGSRSPDLAPPPLPPEAPLIEVPVAHLAPAVAVVRPRSSPVLDVIPVEEPPPLPRAGTVVEMTDTDVDRPAARSKPRQKALPSEERFPVPDWVVGLGLPPDGIVARYWLVCLGALLGLPVLLGLFTALLFVFRPSNNGPVGPPPVVRKTTLRAPAEVQLRGGRSAEMTVSIDRPEEEAPLRVVVSGLPFPVRHGGEVAVPPGQGDAVATVRLQANPDAPAGKFEATVTLYRGNEKVDEKSFGLTTVAFIRPILGEVSAIELTQGGTRDVIVAVDRNGSPDPLSLTVEPLPKGVTPQPLPAAPDQLGVRLTVDADAEVVEGRLVQISLRADGVMAQQKTVSLSVRASKSTGNPGVKLTFPPELTLVGLGQARLEVSLQRVDYDGPVTVAAEKLPFRVTADPIEVPAGENRCVLTFRCAAQASETKIQIDVVARIGERRAGREKLDLMLKPGNVPQPPDQPKTLGAPEPVLITTADGLKLKATYYPSKEGKANPCVLILPDLTAAGRLQREWQALAVALQKQGCPVLSLDCRGYGENTFSLEAIPPTYSRVPANATGLTPQFIQALKLSKTTLQTMNQLNGTVAFTPAYLPWLVQDVIAARLWLDLKHDLEEVNTNNLILIAEGDATALGMIWLALEAKRHKDGAQGTYESRDLYGAAWLEPRLTLKGATPAGMKTVMSQVHAVKTWPPMLTAYDSKGASARLVPAWKKTFEQGGKMGSEKALTVVRGGFGAERTLLSAEGAEKAITDYVAELRKNQPLRAWAKRDVLTNAYSWDLGNSRSSAAKPAKLARPSLAPLNDFGFPTLKIR